MGHCGRRRALKDCGSGSLGRETAVGRVSEYALFAEEWFREEYDLDPDVDVDFEEFAGHPGPGVFAWFQSKLKGRSDLAISRDDAPDFDVFVSFASERRVEVVHPLVEELNRRGLSVGFDNDQGDVPAARSIDNELLTAQVGVVMISPEFFHQPFTRHELIGMVLAGVQAIVLVAYQLDGDGERIVEQLGEELARSRDVTYVRLRSNRVTRLGQRVAAAVRRMHHHESIEPAEAEEVAVWQAVDAYLHKLPDPRRLELEKLHRELIEHLESGRAETQELVAYGRLHPEELESIDERVHAYVHLNTLDISNDGYARALLRIWERRFTPDEKRRAWQ